MDFPVTIIWTSRLSILGVLGGIFSFLFQIPMKIIYANRIAPNGTLQKQNAASHLGLFCLHMSHKKDARLICFNSNVMIRVFGLTSKYFRGVR